MRPRHNLLGTDLYTSWRNMRYRATRTTYHPHQRYRHLGICHGLKSSPQYLLWAVGPRTSRSLSIDRIDNERGYHCGRCPECIDTGWRNNLTWSTRRQQRQNSRDNRRVTYRGRTLILAEWSRATGVSCSTLHYRLRKQWPMDEVFKPTGRKRPQTRR